jgi:hypothetical protein
MKHWSASQIERLSRMRAGFLDGTAGRSDYWQDAESVALYDRTFGARIQWKWEAVLAELRGRGWNWEAEALVDLGCGAGVAGRSMLAFREASAAWAGRVTVMDRSPWARAYSAGQLRSLGVDPGRILQAGSVREIGFDGALVVASHVVGELSDGELSGWIEGVQAARALLWVEAGTREISRRLMERVREPLREAGWRAVAPCTHAQECPLRAASLERHWCHHFAPVPAHAHQDPAWRELSAALGIDLRVLPYSFILMESPRFASLLPPGGDQTGAARVIGRARTFKGYVKVLSCAESGSGEWMLQKRDAPDAFRELSRGDGPFVYHWETGGGEGAERGEGNRIRSARRHVPRND